MAKKNVIIGAGAAGLMCAAQAGKRGNDVLLLDHSANIGRKIRISGGGRCNFTNIYAVAESFLSNNPHFCISALKRFTQHDFIKLVDKHNIKYHEKTKGQLFCDDSAQQIIDMLLLECKQANVKIQTKIKITDIEKTKNGFLLRTDANDIECESLVIATGGLSIPKMGATGFGYDIAKKFAINIIQPRAALVPFTLKPNTLPDLAKLSGVSAMVNVFCNGMEFTESLLFTHRGLSGPAILQISSYWQEGDIVKINLTPYTDIESLLKEHKITHPKQNITTLLGTILPKRLVKIICQEQNFDGKLADLSKKKIKQFAKRINAWEIIPAGTEGYRTAEVTLGGIDTNELSSKTFEAKKVPGLFFIGEVIDVTGHLGGFNFQWAWSSGYCAGQYI